MPTRSGLDVGTGWVDLQARLRKAADGAAVRKAMNTRIRTATKPVEAALKAAVLAVEVKGSRGGGGKQRTAHRAGSAAAAGAAARRARAGSGLRATVARAIQTKITNSGPRAGVRIRVDTMKLPDGQKKLAKYLDGQGRWRHPTFGRDPWVLQFGSPWWTPTIRRMYAGLRAEVQKIQDDVRQELMK